MSTERRQYRKRQRADDEARTRRRITEATVALHETVGPLHTTVKAVAERAGVQRATVYRHFPDEGAFFAACSAHWVKRHDPPDAAPWAAIADPDERPARRAWRDVPLLPRGRADDGKRAPRRGVRRDARVPAAADARLVAAIAGLVLEGRPERGRRRTRVAALA